MFAKVFLVHCQRQAGARPLWRGCHVGRVFVDPSHLHVVSTAYSPHRSGVLSHSHPKPTPELEALNSPQTRSTEQKNALSPKPVVSITIIIIGMLGG